MNKGLIAGIAVLVLIVLGIYFLGSSSNVTGNVVSEGKQDNTKSFVITSSHLKFYIDGVENPEIRVKEGDKVRIDFTSEEGFHDWRLDEFGAATEKVNPGTPTSVEFVANKKGTFEYYCSVGKHRALGMKGVFIVE